MAFLTKEKKFFTLKKEENEEVGPGLYISQTQKRMTKSNFAPFGSNTKKKTSIYIDNSPGPGSYFSNDTYTNSKSNIPINDKEHKKSQNFSRLTIDNLIRNKSEEFIKTSISSIKINDRFKSTYKDYSVPGPGFYFRDDKNSHKTKKKNKPISIKNLEFINFIQNSNDLQFKSTLSGPFYNASTIPPRLHSFGYEVVKGGDIIPRENPNMYKTFSGSKNDSVGPGSYDIDFPNKWEKTGTAWSKMKTFRERPQTNKKVKIRKNIMKSLQDERNSKNIISLNDIKKIKQNSLSYKYNIKADPIFKIPTKGGFLDYEIKIHAMIPGPGYYFIEKIPIEQKKKSEEEINAQRQTSRFSYNDNKDINQIAPNTYFKDNIKSKKKLKEKFDFPIKTKINQMIGPSDNNNNQIPFNSTTERFGHNKKSNSLSDVEIKQINHFINPSFNCHFDSFGAKEPRFSDAAFSQNKINCKDKFPGPGEYINPYSNTGTSNTIQYKGMLISLEEAKKLNIVKSEETHSILPKAPNQAFGKYYPEFYNSIRYRDFKKINKGLIVPFGSFSPKMVIERKKNNNLGPGEYIKDKKIIVEQRKAAFHIKDKRKLTQEYKHMIAPGSYESSTAFPWRKKEFNVLYI